MSLDDVLYFPCDVERLANDHTLITDAGAEDGFGSKVMEVDPAGRIVWRYDQGLRFAHSAKRLDNGRTLITDTTNNRVIEVNPAGQIVFSSDEWSNGTGTLSDGSHLHYPNDAHELIGGDLFITDRNNDRCLRVTRTGQVVWSYADGLRRPHNCDWQDNGRILIADSNANRIVEIDQAGQVCWEYAPQDTPLSWPRDADRLPNGNVLITDSKNARLLEVNRTGHVVWRYQVDHFANFYDADGLANGNVLFSDQQHHRVVEINRLGEVVWEFRNYQPRLKTHARLVNGTFTRRDESGRPEGWTLVTRVSEGGGELIWTTNAQGKPSPGLRYDRDGGLCLQQNIAVRPGQRYVVRTALKTQDVTGVVCMQMAFQDKMGGLVQDALKAPRGRVMNGTCDWTTDEFEAVAPAHAAAAEIRLFISGKGEVWVDGVSVDIRGG